MSSARDVERPLTVTHPGCAPRSNDQPKRRLRFALGMLLAFAIVGAFYAYTHEIRYRRRRKAYAADQSKSR